MFYMRHIVCPDRQYGAFSVVVRKLHHSMVKAGGKSEGRVQNRIQ